MAAASLQVSVPAELPDPRTFAETDLCPEPADDTARAFLIDFWERRADGECTTAKAFEHVASDLHALGAHDAVQALAMTSIANEQRHTEWCTRMAQRLGSTRDEPRVLGNKPLQLSSASERENQWLRAVYIGCVSETIAVHVLRESHRDLISPTIREANRQHLAEEINHSRLGWAFLAWAAQCGALGDDERRFIEGAMPTLFELAESTWQRGFIEADEALGGFGYFTSAHVQRGIAAATVDVILPGLQRFGIRVAKSRG